MNKDELVAQLTELGKKLNREVILTGSKEDLTLRVTELEEELGDEDDGEGGSVQPLKPINELHQQKTPENTAPDLTAGELVLVETLATLHIEALHETRNEKLMIVGPGVVIRISQQDATALIDQGLAYEH